MRRTSVLIIILIISLFSMSFADDKKISLSIINGDIKDVLVMITQQSGMNMVPDETVQGRITINLENVSFEEAIKTLDMVYGYKFKKISDTTYMATKKEDGISKEIDYSKGKISFNIKNREISEVLNEISNKAGVNIVIDKSVRGPVSGKVSEVTIDSGLTALLESNGFSFSLENNIYKVFLKMREEKTDKLNISVKDGLVTMDVEQAPLQKVLFEVIRQAKMNLVLLGGVSGFTNVKMDKTQLDKAVEVVLYGTNYTFKKDGSLFIVGEKGAGRPSSDMLTTSDVINIQNIKAEKLPALLPSNFQAGNIKILPDQNAIIYTGTQKEIDDLKAYIPKVDVKVPQITIEALMIELSYSDNENPKIDIGMNYADTGKTFVDLSQGVLNYQSISTLPKDFYVKLQALIQKGKAKVKANPNITTINGERAVINVGTVQYYKVASTTTSGSSTTETGGYQSINAGVTLDVTPWVNASGDIMLKLLPTVSNIGGAALTTDGPPSISRREAQTSVRIRDGETVIIGGLIQNVGKENISKIPILGDIPLLGTLFTTSNKDSSQTELIICVTPHVVDDKKESIESKKKLDKLIKE